MKYAVLYNLQFETATKRDKLDTAIKDAIVDKATWGETVCLGSQDEAGHPIHRLVIRFEDKSDMDELFALISRGMQALPAKGKVSRHICYHDETQHSPCETFEYFEKE